MRRSPEKYVIKQKQCCMSNLCVWAYSDCIGQTCFPQASSYWMLPETGDNTRLSFWSIQHGRS